jgi:hypothetical protein
VLQSMKAQSPKKWQGRPLERFTNRQLLHSLTLNAEA